MEKVNLRMKARKGSPKMKQSGMLGTVNVEFLNKDKSKALIRIDGIVVRKSKKKGQRPWVAMPQVEYQDKNGDTQYKTVVKIAPDEEIGDEEGFKFYFDSLVLKALKKAIEAGDDDEERKPKPKPKEQSSDWDDDDDDKDEKPKKKDESWDDDDSGSDNDNDDEDIW